MSRINNQIQHRISEMTVLGMKKKEAQAITRAFYKDERGDLKDYQLSKTYFIRSINTAKSYRKMVNGSLIGCMPKALIRLIKLLLSLPVSTWRKWIKPIQPGQ